MSSRTKKAGAVLALVVGVAALTALPAAATKTVKIPSTVKISVYAYKGTIKSPNSGCVEERTVVLKQKGHGVLGRTKSTETGSWEVNPEKLVFKGQLPYKVYAEVKPLSQGTAGTIYKCGAATSKTITINGG